MLWYTNLNEIISNSHSRGQKQATSEKWAKSIDLTIKDNRYNNIHGHFERGYLAIHYSGMVWNKDKILFSAFRWKSIRDLKSNPSAFGWIQLSQNPELFNSSVSTFTHFFSGGYLYFSFTQENNSPDDLHVTKVLASFKLQADYRLTKNSAREIRLDQAEFPFNPKARMSRLLFNSSQDHIFASNGRVFAFSGCIGGFAIHSFYNRSILPIGGSNIGVPGTFAIGPIEMLFSWNRRGFFGKESHRTGDGKPMFLVYRYMLR